MYGRSDSSDRIYQLFRNPVDCPNGFFRVYTLCDPDAVDVIIDPVLRLNASTAVLVLDEQTNRVKLDISMMVWQPKTPVQMKLGEKVSNF